VGIARRRAPRWLRWRGIVKRGIVLTRSGRPESLPHHATLRACPQALHLVEPLVRFVFHGEAHGRLFSRFFGYTESIFERWQAGCFLSFCDKKVLNKSFPNGRLPDTRNFCLLEKISAPTSKIHFYADPS
jgi:hypothetical protein